ncbi:MAG: hypothetical protein WBG61_08400, partial [Desulfobacterales bacterium]
YRYLASTTGSNISISITYILFLTKMQKRQTPEKRFALLKIADMQSRPRWLSSAEEFHPHALQGRVENWRGALWVRFQFPPRQTQHADFPHYAYSVSFT